MVALSRTTAPPTFTALLERFLESDACPQFAVEDDAAALGLIFASATELALTVKEARLIGLETARGRARLVGGFIQLAAAAANCADQLGLTTPARQKDTT